MKGGRARGKGRLGTVLLLVLTSPQNAIKWVWRHGGSWGLATLSVGLLAYFCWWNWPTFQHLPGVASVVRLLSQDSLPTADSQRFSIAVAELEHDGPEQPQQALIIQRLGEQFPHVQVLRVERTISLDEAPVPDEAERAGQAQAQRYLRKMGADVILWGKVTRLGEPPQTLPKLYWTVSRDAAAPKPGGQDMLQGLALPHVPWSELVPVFDLLVMTQDAQEQHLQGRNVTGRLKPLIGRVRDLLKEHDRASTWNAEARASTKFILAGSLLVLGELSGQDSPLKSAAAAYRTALKDWPQERVPLKWATTQNNLGNALRLLGERQSDAALLCEALTRHVAAQELLSSVAPAYTPLAQGNTARSTAAVQALSGPQAPQACLDAAPSQPPPRPTPTQGAKARG